MTRVAIHRPEPGASETKARALAIGLDAFTLPLFVIEPIAWSIPEGRFDGLLLTSANAVRMAGPHLAEIDNLSVHAVGAMTAASARDAGLDVQTTGTSDVAALLERIGPDVRLLHLAGEDRRDVGDRPGPHVTAIPVYRSRALDQVDGLEGLAGGVSLVHSTRAAHRLGELLDRQAVDRSTISLAALSPAIASAAGSGWRALAAADEPKDEALLALARKLCEMSDRP